MPKLPDYSRRTPEVLNKELGLVGLVPLAIRSPV
jgi:hypothetical protein